MEKRSGGVDDGKMGVLEMNFVGEYRIAEKLCGFLVELQSKHG